jgi:hypothetical protein
MVIVLPPLLTPVPPYVEPTTEEFISEPAMLLPVSVCVSVVPTRSPLGGKLIVVPPISKVLVKFAVPDWVKPPLLSGMVAPDVPVLSKAAVPKGTPLEPVQVITPVEATIVQSPLKVKPPNELLLLYSICPLLPPGGV